MKLTYAIGVCTESVELSALLCFLERTKDAGDDINVLVDTTKVTMEVRHVLSSHPAVTVCERDFAGNFSDHRNYHITQCTGDYIFMIDADEIPQEELINNVRASIANGNELVYVPRINICPGYTKSWLAAHKFNVNQCGWINWPDFQGRIFKNSKTIKWGNNLHEKIEGATKITAMQADPRFALWHVKTVEKQNKQGEFYDSL